MKMDAMKVTAVSHANSYHACCIWEAALERKWLACVRASTHTNFAISFCISLILTFLHFFAINHDSKFYIITSLGAYSLHKVK